VPPSSSVQVLAQPADGGTRAHLAIRYPLKFAVQREDPRLEEMLLDRLAGRDKRFFGVTAAGCTVLQLAAREDLAELVSADFDPRQSAWACLRLNAARQLSRRDFCRVTGISQIDPAVRESLLNKLEPSLPAEDRAYLRAERAFFAAGAFDNGSFERLFAGWRCFLERFALPREAIQRIFDGDASLRDALVASPMWPISFELFFHHSLLLELFGPQAIQHAPPGSYARYFRARFEWALQQPDAPSNPYLSHTLRGRYGAIDQDDAVPEFLLSDRYPRIARGASRVRFFTGDLIDALRAHPGPYDLIQLSNILDWSSDAECEAVAVPVLDNLAPGGFLLVRQLNNVRPLPTAWTRGLDFDPGLERELHAADRSFFYSAIRVGRKA
jgi:S-adenosylmethionine-diacylglycerol 3-amino-3-carboxypropyl transferase